MIGILFGYLVGFVVALWFIGKPTRDLLRIEPAEPVEPTMPRRRPFPPPWDAGDYILALVLGIGASCALWLAWWTFWPM